jgi:hypothetical protein
VPATAVGPAAGGLLNTGNWQATRASGVGSGFITACTLPLTPQHMPFPGWLHQLTLPLLSSSALSPSAFPACLPRQLRGIVASYRMTARSMPSKASPYVEKVLDPLRKFLKVGACMGPCVSGWV